MDLLVVLLALGKKDCLALVFVYSCCPMAEIGVTAALSGHALCVCPGLQVNPSSACSSGVLCSQLENFPGFTVALQGLGQLGLCLL